MINQPSSQMSLQPDKYLRKSVYTASQAQLLFMLFDGAIRFCKSGIDAITKSDLVEAEQYIRRAEDIIMEFIVTLDKSSPIAEGLIQIYDYMKFRLIEANTKQVVGPIVEVVGFLTEMRETWVQVEKQLQVENQPGEANG